MHQHQHDDDDDDYGALSRAATATLSTTAKVLLAQAVSHLGSRDFGPISSLLIDNPLLAVDSAEHPFDPDFCEKAFNALMKLEGCDPSETEEPGSRPARKLAWKYYGLRLSELFAQLQSTVQEHSEIARNVVAIKEGAWDAKLRAEAGLSVERDPTEELRSSRVPDSEEPQSGTVDSQHPDEQEVIVLPTPTPEPEPELVAEEETVKEEGRRPSSRKGRSPQPSAAPSTRTTRRTRGEDDDPEPEPQEEAGEDDDDEDDDDAESEREEVPFKGKKKGALRNEARRNLKRKQSEPAASPAAEKPSRKRAKTEEQADETLPSDKDVKQFKTATQALLTQLSDNPNAHFFTAPVLKSHAPAYETTVRRPMSIRDVSRRVRDGTDTTTVEVMRDVALICANAVQFNGVDEEVGVAARELWNTFEGMMQVRMSSEFVHN